MSHLFFECGIFDSALRYKGMPALPPRTVSYFEIELFISCTGTIFVNDEHYAIAPNTLLIAKPGQIRRREFDFKCYFLHYAIDRTHKYYDSLMNAPNHYQIIDGKRYLHIFEDLIYYANTLGVSEHGTLISAKLDELIYFLVRDAAINSNFSALYKQDVTSYQQMPKIVNYIEEHYAEELSLDVLANIAGYSKNYFQMLFKSIFQTTPQKYVENIRLSRAKKLLGETQDSLIDIAYNCGFSSQAYFNYVFKKQTNVTPLQYRRLCLNKYLTSP